MINPENENETFDYYRTFLKEVHPSRFKEKSSGNSSGNSSNNSSVKLKVNSKVKSKAVKVIKPK